MVPVRFYSGEKVEFSITGKAGQSLAIYFRGAESFTFAATDSGSDALFSFSKTVTTPGKYIYQIISTYMSVKTVIQAGEVEIMKALDEGFSTGSFEIRSQAEIDLDAVKSAIRAIISGGAVKSYTIGTRSLTKMDMSELIMLESKLKVEVGREKKAKALRNGLPNPHSLKVRFR